MARTSRTPKPQRKCAILNLCPSCCNFRVSPKRGLQRHMPAPAVRCRCGTGLANIQFSETGCPSTSSRVVAQISRHIETRSATPYASARCGMTKWHRSRARSSLRDWLSFRVFACRGANSAPPRNVGRNTARQHPLWDDEVAKATSKGEFHRRCHEPVKCALSPCCLQAGAMRGIASLANYSSGYLACNSSSSTPASSHCA